MDLETKDALGLATKQLGSMSIALLDGEDKVGTVGGWFGNELGSRGSVPAAISCSSVKPSSSSSGSALLPVPSPSVLRHAPNGTILYFLFHIPWPNPHHSWGYGENRLIFLSNQSFHAKKAVYFRSNWRCDSVPFRKI